MFFFDALLSIDDFLPLPFIFHLPLQFSAASTSSSSFRALCAVSKSLLDDSLEFDWSAIWAALITYAGQVSLVKIVPVCREASLSLFLSLSLLLAFFSCLCRSVD